MSEAQDMQPDPPLSQAEKDNLERKPIPINGFLRFLTSVTNESACIACGETQFTTLSNPVDPETAAIFLFHVSSQDGDSRSAPAAGVICANCGWLRYHTTLAVRNWIANNPDDGAADSQGSEDEA